MIRKNCTPYKSLILKPRGSLFKTMAKVYLPYAIGFCITFILTTSPAWAVQSHGGLEGLVSHQIGHFLFALGMAYLLFRLHYMQRQKAGWFEFKTFLWLLIAWNIMTFSGHWLNELVAREKFIKANATTLSFTVENFQDALFYLTRLDHVILVPCFTFLLLALSKWRLQK